MSSPRPASATAEDAAPEPPAQAAPGVVYVLPVSHLDTQWRWTVRDTVGRFLPRTVVDNAAAFRRFPHYCVNFDGAFRYAMLRRCWPEAWEEVRRWVAAGRWKVSGATWEAMDVNIPSPESLIRQVLYGRRFFRRHLGVDPRDLFLPDCFGFGAQLPIVAGHCRLTGLATSKLRRGSWMRSAVGVPFPVGVWEGADGSELLAVLDPGGYGERLQASPAEDPEVLAQLDRQEGLCGERFAVRFFGVGDKGGAPAASSLEALERAVAGSSPVRTVPSGSDELFRRLAEDGVDRLPRHRGELLLSEHGTGCYTSQGAMKRWNRRNELLLEAAEKAAAAADWLGGLPYPAESLRNAWRRLLWHQFHDDLTGTSIPQAYAISWHDEALVANLAATALRRAMGAVARALDTRAEGIPLVVFNPLSIPRTEVVEAWLELPAAWAAIAATGPAGEPLPVQLGVARGGLRQVLILAELPPLGFAVIDVHQGRPGSGASGALEVTRAALSNERLAARLDGAGDLASLVDSRHGREALAAPHRLELLPDTSKRFPAWELRYQDVMAEPLPVAGPSRVTVVEHGPVRVAVEVVRTAAGSTFRQRYRLAAGAAGDRLEVAARVDWRSRGRLLKASFPFAAAAEEAVYDLGVCAIRRGTNRPRLYEVPAQQWAAVEAPDAAWGAAVLATTNQGWDLPAPGRLRLSLVRTPRVGRRFRHQGWQDLGRHHLLWALAPFAGGWWQDRVPWLAARLNQPPLAVATTAHPGALGRRWSFLEVDDERLMVRAVKGAEDGAGVVVRGVELSGEGAAATLRAAAPVRRSQRVDGVEDPLAEIHPLDGAVPLQTPAHRPLAVLLELAPPPAALALAPPRWRALPLSGDRRVATRRGEPCRDGIGRRRALPAELLPQQLDWLGIGFQLGETPRALACRGQSLPLADDAAAASNEAWTHLFLLAGSAGGELRLELRVDATTHAVSLPAVTGPLGQWDRLRRIGWGRFSWRRRIPGFFTRADVGLAVDHLHDRRGHLLPYAQAQLFVVTLPLPSGARALHLPTAPAALLFAATLAADPAASVREAFHLSTPGPGGATARRGSRW